MTKIAPLIAFVFAAAALAAPPGSAAELASTTASPYRLQIERPEAYRVMKSEAYAPAPVLPKQEPAPPPRTAGNPFATEILSAALGAGIDPALVHALIFVESRYNPAARSPKGALGLMQVLPETAVRYGVRDPSSSLEANLRAGTLYLSDLMSQFDRRLDLVLAAYNAGENAVRRYGGRIPPYRETQLYVPAVLGKYSEWQNLPRPVPVSLPGYLEYLPGTRLLTTNLWKRVPTVDSPAAADGSP